MDKRKKIMTGIGAAAVLALIYFLYQHFTYVTTDDAYVEAHAHAARAQSERLYHQGERDRGPASEEGRRAGRDRRARLRERVPCRPKASLPPSRPAGATPTALFSRIADLYKNGAVSQQQFDTANATHTDTRAKYDAVAAQVAQAQLNLDNTKLRAPSDGFIAKRSVEVGQLSAAGVPLIGFVDGGERWVTANFKETDIEHIKPGAHVGVNVDAIGSKKLPWRGRERELRHRRHLHAPAAR